MAKIGVVTFSNTVDNYGQVLQYLATQEFLKSLGHDVYLLRPLGHRVNVFQKIIQKLKYEYTIYASKFAKQKAEDQEKALLFSKWSRITNENEKTHPRFFQTFYNDNCRIITGFYEDIIKERFDIICVGSDQTWSTVSERYMLGWCGTELRRISLAASTGHKEFSSAEIKRAKSLLEPFEIITVREESGLDFCKRCNRNDAIKILDPSFLLSSNIYNKYISNQTKYEGNNYVFIYMLGAPISKPIHSIIEFVKAKGYSVKYVESQGRNEEEEKLYPRIEEWLYYLQNSSYVITNSFHGVAFSIIYNKPFMAFPLTGVMESMNGRINGLLSQLKLSSRLYSGNLEALFSTMDWEYANTEIENNKEKVKKIFKL